MVGSSHDECSLTKMLISFFQKPKQSNNSNLIQNSEWNLWVRTYFVQQIINLKSVSQEPETPFSDRNLSLTFNNYTKKCPNTHWNEHAALHTSNIYTKTLASMQNSEFSKPKLLLWLQIKCFLLHCTPTQKNMYRRTCDVFTKFLYDQSFFLCNTL